MAIVYHVEEAEFAIGKYRFVLSLSSVKYRFVLSSVIAGSSLSRVKGLRFRVSGLGVEGQGQGQAVRVRGSGCLLGVRVPSVRVGQVVSSLFYRS